MPMNYPTEMTELVGILNITPDSFSDGGLYDKPSDAIARAAELFQQGASIVDIGAESTRPQAVPLSADEEWQRLEPVLLPLMDMFPNKLSLDSYHPENIERALRRGPVIVNDITGMNNQSMVDVVLRYKPMVIVSHLPGLLVQAAHQTTPVHDVSQVSHDLLARARALEAGGLQRDKIILDPGIGFGKTPGLNHELLAFGDIVPEYPVMIGYSRKRFLGDHRMEIGPNLEAGQIAIQHGARYLRVHDVVGHMELLSYIEYGN